MPLHGMACFTPKSASIPLDDRHEAFVAVSTIVGVADAGECVKELP